MIANQVKSAVLAGVLGDSAALMEFRSQLLTGRLAEGLLQKTCRILATRTDEALRFQLRFSARRHDNLNDLVQAAPPFTWTVSLIDPSLRGASVTECPLSRASNLAFSTVYACRNSSSRFCEPQRPL